MPGTATAAKLVTLQQTENMAKALRATDHEYEEMLDTLGLSSVAAGVQLTHETFTFELDDGTLINKELVLWPLM